MTNACAPPSTSTSNSPYSYPSVSASAASSRRRASSSQIAADLVRAHPEGHEAATLVRFEEDRRVDFTEIQRRAAGHGLPSSFRKVGRSTTTASTPSARPSTRRETGRVVSFSLACFRQVFRGRQGHERRGERADRRSGLRAHPNAVLKGIETQSVKDRLRAATDEALALGVEGHPDRRLGRPALLGR